MVAIDSVDNLERLSAMLAAHGVYALTIIFIFYQQWRAYQNVKASAPQDHTYFRKVHASAIVATYTLGVISTGVWIYATFLYTPKYYFKGSVTGLTEQLAAPQNPGDRPKVVESIIPEPIDVELYQSKKNSDETSDDGKYDLGWVLLPHENMGALVFRFQHHYEIMGARESVSQLSLSPRMNRAERKTIPRRFQIDLKQLKFKPGDFIQLMYEAAEDPRQVGKVYVRHDGRKTEIPWEPDTGRSIPVPSAGLFSITTALASTKASVFKDDGTYDPQFGRNLRSRLGSSDLKTQIGARQLLIDEGSRSFKFMLDSLKEKKESGYDSDLLIHNIAEALQQIEVKGTHPKEDLVVELAIAFYDTGDYDSSALFFRKAPDRLSRKNDYFLRAYVYAETGMTKDALTEYDKFLRSGPDDDNRAIVYNNIAYLYAESDVKLPEALSLADQALRMQRSNANFKDTKGWILFKLKQYNAAVAMLNEALSGDPGNQLFKSHLQAAQNFVTKK
jgi:tetratricopeptide (TPR) repeat protein